MPFWTSALSEPRRGHRFLLSLPNLVSTNQAFRYEQYLAKTVTKPAYTVSEQAHKFLGNTYYYPGVVEWDPVSATIVNAINPDGNKILYDALVNSGYLKPDVQEAVFNNPAQAPGTVNKQGASFRGIDIPNVEYVINRKRVTNIKNIYYTNDVLCDSNIFVCDISRRENVF